MTLRGEIQALGMREAREKWRPRGFAGLLDEIESGRLMTIVVKKQLAVTLVSPREYDRLRSLTLAVTWFRTAGLDLETAEPDQIRSRRIARSRSFG